MWVFVYKKYRKSALVLIVFVSCRRFPVSLLNLFIAVPLFGFVAIGVTLCAHTSFAISHICSTSTLSTVSNLPNHAVNLQLRISTHSLSIHSTASVNAAARRARTIRKYNGSGNHTICSTLLFQRYYDELKPIKHCLT